MDDELTLRMRRDLDEHRSWLLATHPQLTGYGPMLDAATGETVMRFSSAAPLDAATEAAIRAKFNGPYRVVFGIAARPAFRSGG